MNSYRIIPDFTVDNKVCNTFARELYNYKSLLNRTNILKEDDNEYLEIEDLDKCFEIKITKDSVKFYFHSNDKSDLNSLKKNFPKATIKKEDHELFFIEDNISVSEMQLQHHYFLSLSTDKRTLEPISSILETQNILKEDDFALIQFVLTPESTDWHEGCSEAYKKFKQGGLPKQLRFDFSNVIKPSAKLLANTGVGILNSIQYFLVSKDKDFDKIIIHDDDIAEILKDGQLSNSTMNKSKYNAFKTTIRLVSSCKNLDRKNQILRSLEISFNSLNSDNYLVPKRIDHGKSLFDMFDLIYNKTHSFTTIKNILSSEEIAKLLYLPTKALQEQYKMDKIETREITIPKELIGGTVPIGSVSNKGIKTLATWPKDKNIMSLPKIVVGPQNSGKTTYTVSFTKGTHKAGNANFIIDYIQDCSLSKKISKEIPEKDQVIIDIADINNIFPMVYSEASNILNDDSSSFEKLRIASLLANQVEYLINAVNVGSEELKPRMLRFLYAASMISFIHRDSITDTVFKVLRNWKIRNEYIRSAKYSNCFEEDDEIFQDLEELHERDSDGKIIGTREHLISPIINRLTMLSRNVYIKAMLKAPTDSKANVDFIKLINEGKTIHIRIPQVFFPDSSIRDTIATFFVTRLWLCAQLRDQENNNLCHLVIDEVHQVKVLLSFLSNHITEFRRHKLAPYFTCHYLKQFGKLLDSVKSANVSYLLLAGTEEENIRTLQNSIKPFSIEDGLKLKAFESLNIVNYGNQYSKFISKLPKVL